MNRKTFTSIWDALEDTPEAAAKMKARAKLMQALQSYVGELQGTQTEKARHLGITQPRLSDLLQGKIDKFSLDALVSLLAHVGKEVIIDVQDAA